LLDLVENLVFCVFLVFGFGDLLVNFIVGMLFFFELGFLRFVDFSKIFGSIDQKFIREHTALQDLIGK
jgi:hypothetical protein